MNEVVSGDETNEAYTMVKDSELRKYISCIIQLKDNMSYLNIVLDSINTSIYNTIMLLKQYYELYDNLPFQPNTSIRISAGKTQKVISCGESMAQTPDLRDQLKGHKSNLEQIMESMNNVVQEAIQTNTRAIVSFYNINGDSVKNNKRIQIVKGKLVGDKELIQQFQGLQPMPGLGETNTTLNINSNSQDDSSQLIRKLVFSSEHKPYDTRSGLVSPSENIGDEEDSRINHVQSLEAAKKESQLQTQVDQMQKLINDLEQKKEKMEKDLDQLKKEIEKKEKNWNDKFEDMVFEMKTIEKSKEVLNNQIEGHKLTIDGLTKEKEQIQIMLLEKDLKIASAERKLSKGSEKTEESHKTIGEIEQRLKSEKEQSEHLYSQIDTLKKENFNLQIGKSEAEKRLMRAEFESKKLSSKIEDFDIVNLELKNKNEQLLELLENLQEKNKQAVPVNSRAKDDLNFAVHQLSMIILNHGKDIQTLSKKDKSLLREIFSENFLYILDLYEQFMMKMEKKKRINAKYYKKYLNECNSMNSSIMELTELLFKIIDILEPLNIGEAHKDIIILKRSLMAAKDEIISKNNAAKNYSNHIQRDLKKISNEESQELLRLKTLTELQKNDDEENGEDEDAKEFKTTFDFIKSFYKTTIKELKQQNSILNSKLSTTIVENASLSTHNQKVLTKQNQIHNLSMTIKALKEEKGTIIEKCNKIRQNYEKTRENNEELKRVITDMDEKIKELYEINKNDSTLPIPKKVQVHEDCEHLLGFLTCSASLLEEQLEK